MPLTRSFSFSVAMTGMARVMAGEPAQMQREVVQRSFILSCVAFFSLVDLFGTQALLPMLADSYDAASSAIGVAANAPLIGMAVSSLCVTLFARRMDRRIGIALALALLAIPTALLASMPDLRLFTLLRVMQGICMGAAFTLTLTYFSERCAVMALGGAMAAFVTGTVAANLLGRLLASGMAEEVGLWSSFVFFAVLNLMGALLAWLWLRSEPPDDAPHTGGTETFQAWAAHLSDPHLRAAFGLSFVALFMFAATFSYASFALAAPPFVLPQMSLGLVYLVFLPSVLTTPLAARTTARWGSRAAGLVGVGLALPGLGLLLAAHLPLVLLGLAMTASGLLFTLAVAASFVGRYALRDRAAAQRLYLAAAFIGGITGAWLMGMMYAMPGWTLTVAMLIVILAVLGRFVYQMSG